MKALLLGYSSIARRRVLPAFAAIGVRDVDVASRSGRVTMPEGLSGSIFHDYADALRDSEAGLVYISTVNSLHAELGLAALESGRHLVIDKPAATELSDVRRLVELAGQKSLLLAEATVYGHHPQIALARGVFDEVGIMPTHLVAAFSFPPVPPDNFRRRAELGGGSLLDLGPYAISVGRLFFRDAPLEIISRASFDAFSLLATYPGNRTLAGHFGMTTGYVNRLEILGPDTTVAIERAFTTTPDLVCKLRVNHRDVHRTIEVPPSDSFAIFLSDVFRAIESGGIRHFAEVMLADAQALERLRVASNVINPS